MSRPAARALKWIKSYPGRRSLNYPDAEAEGRRSLLA
jgi:hypothetical protein